MPILFIILIAISLSMDAFYLSLIYGTLKMSNKIENRLSIMVGIFHFIMPILGQLIGNLILNILKINIHLITGIIFIVLAIEMIISVGKKEEIKELKNIISEILFAVAVSIDSFIVGINLGINNTDIIFPAIIFMIISSIFTYTGLKLGKKISNIMGNIPIVIGSIILLLLGLSYLK